MFGFKKYFEAPLSFIGEEVNNINLFKTDTWEMHMALGLGHMVMLNIHLI